MNPLDTNKKTIENGCLTRAADLNYHTQNTILKFFFFVFFFFVCLFFLKKEKAE